MPEYLILGSYEVEWRVTADNADEAEASLEEGAAGGGQVTGWSVEKVVQANVADPLTADDERAVRACGHLANRHTGPWSGEAGQRLKPSPRQCDSYGCACVAPVAQSQMAATRRVDGRPEAAADRKFFDLRESGYRGPIDQNGDKVTDPEILDIFAALGRASGSAASPSASSGLDEIGGGAA